MLELITQSRDVLFVRLLKPFIGNANWLVSRPPNLYPFLNLHLTSTHKCCPQNLNYRGGLCLIGQKAGCSLKMSKGYNLMVFDMQDRKKIIFPFLLYFFLNITVFVLLYSSFSWNSLRKINDWRSATQEYPYPMLFMSGYRCTRVLINR